jgi:penicillin-binding protein 1C
VAVKTGTSKGYRDNWTIGFTHEVSVGVWVGNFDGSPMVRSSGVTGAAPLFRDVMLAAMSGRERRALVDSAGLVEREVCALSGALPSADCPHRRRELFPAGREPHERCTMHERVAIDPTNGLRAGPACKDAEPRRFERFPAEFVAWANDAGRPLAPEAFSPRCPGRAEFDGAAPIVVFPLNGSRFRLDTGSQKQELVLAARAAEGRVVEFFVDGRSTGTARAPFRVAWELKRGDHRVEALVGASRSAPVHFFVE